MPTEMSEQYNWLFKQRVEYIELLKAGNAKTKGTKQKPRSITELLVSNYLIPSSPLIKEFFADSIWEFEYSKFKKDAKSDTSTSFGNKWLSA